MMVVLIFSINVTNFCLHECRIFASQEVGDNNNQQATLLLLRRESLAKVRFHSARGSRMIRFHLGEQNLQHFGL